MEMEGNDNIQIKSEKSITIRYGAQSWSTVQVWMMKRTVSLIDISMLSQCFNTRVATVKGIAANQFTTPCTHGFHITQTLANTQTPELQLRSSSPARRAVAPPWDFPEIQKAYIIRTVFQCWFQICYWFILNLSRFCRSKTKRFEIQTSI